MRISKPIARATGAGILFGFAVFSPLVSNPLAVLLLVIAAALWLTATESPEERAN